MPNALAHLQAASDTISHVRAAADQLHDDLLRLTNDPDCTAEAKQRRMAPLLVRKAELQQELVAARGRLDRVERDAARQLRDAGAADLAQQARTSRAAQRVTQLLATVPVADAAKVLALDEDVDGLRALREALPAHLAVQAQNTGGERQAVEPVQQYLDEITLPLVTGTEPNALLARTQLAAERARLDATLLYVGTGPSPSNRLVIGFAEAERQRRVNPRTGRLDGGAAAPAWPRRTTTGQRPDGWESRSARRRSELLDRPEPGGAAWRP